MFLVVEIQKQNDQISNIVTAHETRSEADSKFYTVLAAAAVSTIQKHAASLLTEDGNCIRSESYNHEDPDLNVSESVREWSE